MPCSERGQSLIQTVILLSVLTLLAGATLRVFGPALAGVWASTSQFFSFPSP